ncbi:caspase family protein [Amycolatopsis sp. OK19-0408]|uniref:Caspase family protein n=1 Tax=Amycolatopsis iheyensis TaxID=2945988 RepID=A0A9X2SRK7_9PSEU|nr:caspase family protein [Amycolatopsis iheyensis]MCR6490165.1 caspase family protein [Amycolatopsis iheyensis]
MANRHALLIATETYADPALRRLTAPGGDARELASVLRDPSIAGFEVTTLIDEPHHVVGEAIGEFYRGRRRDELTLLYFTGHGVKDDDGSLYLAMANTRRDSLMFTALAAELVDRAMAGCPSRQKVLVLDCCYSGAFPAGRLAKSGADVHTLERFQGRGRAVLTASDATQYSFEGDAVTGSAARSVFTRHLVAGLRDGSADLDGDGDVTVDELYSYVHERVVAELPRQRPKHQSDVEGRIVLARNPRWTLPEYLKHGLASPIAVDRLSALEGLKRLNRAGNDVVRAATDREIRGLLEDDSRLVSGTAAAWVAEIDGVAEEPVVAEPVAAEPVAAEPKPEPVAAVVQPDPAPVEPEPEPEPAPTPAAEPDETATTAKKKLTRRAKIILAAVAAVIVAGTVLLIVLLSTSSGGSRESGGSSFGYSR